MKLDSIVPTELLILLLLVGAVIFIWDLLERRSNTLSKSSGLEKKSEVIALKGSSYQESREYRSETLGLTASPYGIVREGEFIIPVEINPLSKKIHDRHVVQMLINMRLIEEIEGVRPPHGLLVMGPEQRAVKLQNTPEKQAWLDSVLTEMRAVNEDLPAAATPSFYKCKNCDVNEICSFTMYRTKECDTRAESGDDDEERS